MPDDRQLLAAYLATRDEQSFTLLVHRYLPLVYAAALRQVRNPAVAEDVTQAVFILLARKAPTLQNHVAISGWLLKAAHFCSRDALKFAQRRAHHEQKAAAMKHESTPPLDPEWEKLSPHLDAALASLSPIDRSAISLKYLEDQTLEQVGSTLNLTKDATHKRLTRALEKLRSLLNRSTGSSLSAVALPALLAAKPALTIPAHLFSTIPAVAFNTSLAATTSSALIAKGAAHMMTALKIKLTLAAAALALVAATSTILIAQAAAPTHSSAAEVRAVAVSEDPPAGTPQPQFAENPAATATLTSGVSAQIVAITRRGRNPADFWNPDGSALAEPFNINRIGRLTFAPDAGQEERRMVLLLKFPRDLSPNYDVFIDGSTGVARSSNENTRGVTTVLLGTTIPKDKTTTTLRIKLATGPWFAVSTDGQYPQQGGNKEGDILISKGLMDKDLLTFVVTTNDPRDLAHRMVITDNDGKTHNESTQSSNWGQQNTKMYSFQFRNLLPADVKEASYQTRTYNEWIEFRNVSLNPATSTKVEIATSDTEKK